MNRPAESAKANMRRLLRARLLQKTDEDREVASLELCRWVLGWQAWKQASCVLLYAPMRDEPDVRVLMEDAWARGKQVCLPRFNTVTGTYEAAACLASQLVPGRYGILEPRPDVSPMPWIQLDLTLVPGVGFTPDGGRIGRGRGFMDRLLVSVQGLKCGVAFDEQLVDALPIEPHDVLLDCILTPTRRWVAGRRLVVE
jgi:5-formyltetrahydrofolate cyclo-ligase